MYADPEHPDRPTSAISSPLYTLEDQALLIALEQYEAGLCACGQPRVVAWHSEMDGWYDGEQIVCHACSAAKGEQVTYARVINMRPASKGPLPPFVLGVTTVSA